MPSRRSLAAIIFAAFSVLYVRTMCPTVYTLDNGELIVAAYKLQIAHPTGYPLFCLLAKTATVLIPFGSVAYKNNLFNALIAAAAVTVLFLALSEVANRKSSAFVAILFGVSPMFWDTSVCAEVYALSAFLVAFELLFLLRWMRLGDKKDLLRLALFAGLAATNHLSSVLILPGILLAVLLKDRTTLKDPALLLKAIIFFVLPLSFYLYLPLRVEASRGSIWGDLYAAYGFKAHVTGSAFKLRMFTSSSADVWKNFLRFLGLLLRQYTVYLVWTLPVGAWLAKKRNGLLAGIVLMTAVNVLYGINYSIGDIETYYVPTVMAVSVLLAIAVECIFVSAGATSPPGPLSESERGKDTMSFRAERSGVEKSAFSLLAFNTDPSASPQDTPHPNLLPQGEKEQMQIPRQARDDMDAAQPTPLPASGRGWGRGLTELTLCVAIAILLTMITYTNFRRMDRHNAYFVMDYARNILNGLEKDALLVASGDTCYNALWYVQQVEGVRPDVIIADRQIVSTWMRGDRDWTARYYYNKISERSPAMREFRNPVKYSRKDILKEKLLADIVTRTVGERPVYMTWVGNARYTYPVYNYVVNYCRLYPEGAVYRVYPKSQEIDTGKIVLRNEEIWSNYQLRGVYDGPINGGVLDKEIPERYAAFNASLADIELRNKMYHQAVKNFTRALKVDDDMLSARKGLGLALACQGKYREAQKEWSAVLAANPKDKLARRYLKMITGGATGTR